MPFEDLVFWLAGGAIVGLFAAEKLVPGRELPRIRLWTVRGVATWVATYVLSGMIPLLWDHLLAPYQLIDLSGVNVAVGALIGMFAVEFVNYWWHRALHKSDFLWRHLHQMHHSVERLDVVSSMTFSPFDLVGWSAMASLALVLFVGLPVESITIASFALMFLNALSHANLRTPRWLGWFVARPEMHGIHHQKAVHGHNYTVLPIIDRVFGTYRNPARWDGETGFYLGASSRYLDLLLGRDVTRPKAALDHAA